MGIVNAHMPHMLNSRNLDLDVECLPTRVTHPSSEDAAPIGEGPDPVYWTAYDLHMIERDARAMRRARVYSMIATYGARLSQLIANGTRALWKNRRQPSVSVERTPTTLSLQAKCTGQHSGDRRHKCDDEKADEQDSKQPQNGPHGVLNFHVSDGTGTIKAYP
jgi:hypothetical protein